MLRERASRGSLVGSTILAALAVIAASHPASVEAAPGDRIGRFPFSVASPPNGMPASDVATAADGRFLVVWEDVASGGQGSDVLARFFTAAGEPSSGQIQLVSGAADGLRHRNAQVESAGDGTFVVVWIAAEAAGPSAEIRGQRYDANGAPLGTRFIVSPSGTVRGSVADLAMATDGRFAVVWNRANSSGTAAPHSCVCTMPAGNRAERHSSSLPRPSWGGRKSR